MSVAQHGAISFLLVTGSRRGDAMLPNLLGEKKAPSSIFTSTTAVGCGPQAIPLIW